MLIRLPGGDAAQMVQVTGLYGDQLNCVPSSCHETYPGLDSDTSASISPAPEILWREICNKNKENENVR